MAEPALIHSPQELLEGPAGTPMSYWKLVWWRLRRDRVTLAAAAVILCIVLSAVLAPYLAPHNPFQGSIRKRLAPVGTAGYMLGTDEQGRDMLSRLLFGGRLSLIDRHVEPFRGEKDGANRRTLWFRPSIHRPGVAIVTLA